MNRIVVALLALGLGLAVGCKKEGSTGGGAAPGPGTASTGTGSTGPGSGGTAPADAPKNPEGCNSDFAQPLVADATLTEKCSPYTLKNDFNLDGYTLTIEPGVELRLANGVQFNVAYYKEGVLQAKGTKEKPVRFTGKRWKGLRFNRGAAGSSLENVVIEGAGTDDQPALFTETHELVLNGVAFTGAKKTVLELKSDRPLKGFTAVDASKGTEDPSEVVHANWAVASNLTPAGLTVPEKSVIWLHGAVDQDVTLTHVGAVFRAPEDTNVDPPDGKTASVTAKEGVTLELGENVALNFGYYRGPAGFKALGTKEKPVTVTRYGEDKAVTPSEGLGFFAGARAPEIDFLVVEYAGNGEGSALTYSDSRGLGKLTNSTFRHLKGAGVRVSGAKERFTAFAANTFDDVEGPALRVPLDLAHGLGAGNTFTDKARVTLFGQTNRDTTLESLGAPYVVEGELAVGGEESKQATLTINPGASLLFNDQGKLSIAYYQPGRLVAKGTTDKPVTFGKLGAGWAGIGLYGKGVVELENVTVSGVGEDLWPLDLTSEVTGTIKGLTLTDTKRGVHNCAAKVKPAGVKADKGVKAIAPCN